jgi:hypothetical protein
VISCWSFSSFMPHERVLRSRSQTFRPTGCNVLGKTRLLVHCSWFFSIWLHFDRCSHNQTEAWPKSRRFGGENFKTLNSICFQRNFLKIFRILENWLLMKKVDLGHAPNGTGRISVQKTCAKGKTVTKTCSFPLPVRLWDVSERFEVLRRNQQRPTITISPAIPSTKSFSRSRPRNDFFPRDKNLCGWPLKSGPRVIIGQLQRRKLQESLRVCSPSKKSQRKRGKASLFMGQSGMKLKLFMQMVNRSEWGFEWL